MSSNNTSSSSIGFLGLLTIVFIVQKLTGSITWSWVWVLSPLWISFIIFIVVLFGAIWLASRTKLTDN